MGTRRRLLGSGQQRDHDERRRVGGRDEVDGQRADMVDRRYFSILRASRTRRCDVVVLGDLFGDPPVERVA